MSRLLQTSIYSLQANKSKNNNNNNNNNNKNGRSKFQLTRLNSDILSFHLVPFLDPEDIISLFLTCKSIHSMLDNEIVWHELYTKSFQSVPQLTSVPITPEIVTRENSNSGNTTPTSGSHRTNISQGRCSSWHDCYKVLRRAKFYSWGAHGSSKRLGNLENNYNRYTCKPLESKIPLKKGAGESIVKVDAGGYSFQILTSQGKLYSTGAGKLGLVDTDNKKVKFFSSGRTQYIAINEKNELLVGDADNKEVIKPDWFMRRTSLTLQEPDVTHIMDPARKLEIYEPESLNIYEVKAGRHMASCRTSGVLSGIILWRRPSVLAFQEDGLFRPLIEFQFCEACFISDNENDPILDYILLSECVIYITKSGSLYRVDISSEDNEDNEDDEWTLSAPIPGVVHKLTNFHSYANSHRVDKFCSENPKFVKISGYFHNFAVVTDDGQLLLGKSESDFPEIIDELQPDGLNSADDGKRHVIVSVAVGYGHYLALNDKGEVYSWGIEFECCGACGLGTRDEVIQKGWGRGYRNLEIPKPQKVEFGDGLIALDVCACGCQSGALVSRL
ncbi:unnamed protein product [Ambrosiozyma monospora]|uniref:Unnamed protein product n=1 Tax=Ambrosiozyma monospora TaxID=43982 RepID=A0A9W6YZC0_AMBMO|nr:unnamed protein product [Ambrosiozyma monospora]